MNDPKHSAFIDCTKTFPRVLESSAHRAQTVSASMKSMRFPMFDRCHDLRVGGARADKNQPDDVPAARLDVGAQTRNSILARTFAGF